jgi:two-component system LytT family response regulator
MANPPNKIRALVVDDEPFARERVVRLLGSEVDIEIVGEAGDGFQAVQMIKSTRPDLVFLDVQMPGRDGFAVLEHLEPDETPVVVFLTAYDQYAVRAFENAALDYILKPFDEDRFNKALRRARSTLEQIASARDRQGTGPTSGGPESEVSTEMGAGQQYLQRFIIRSGGRVFFRRAEEIDWIEAEGNYVRVHSGASAFLMRETISSLEAKLDPAKFARVHRSAIVQIDKIREAEMRLSGSYNLRLASGEHIVMSRRYRRRLPKPFTGGNFPTSV